MKVIVKAPNKLFPDSYDVYLEHNDHAYWLHIGTGESKEAALRAAWETLGVVSAEVHALLTEAEAGRYESV